ncbi:hypothetical protein ENUP19_0053G0022 [Entamoeba nuttalli]|uniref:Uncharacterized protein n=1 Tax=Entamoeba nuttalli TaxID=412467 RepID=A0ABQ0DCJ8_9EUKA
MTSEAADTFNIFNVTPDPNEISAKKKMQETEGKVSVIKLFKYSDWIDMILILVGLISSIGNGVMQPLMMLLMGDMVNSYIYTPGDNTLIDEEVNHMIVEGVKESVNKVVVKMVYFGVISMVLSFLRTFSLFVVSQREGIRVRRMYFKSLLRQDATWYDFQESGELTSRIATDIKNYQDGIGPKFGMIFQIISMGITGYVIGFTKCWDLALVVLATVPLSSFSFTLFQIIGMQYETKALNVFGAAGAIAEETIGNIRTVQSLNQEQEFIEEYEEKIKQNEHFNGIKGQCLGLGFSVITFFMIASYALGSWYGNIVIRGKGGSKGVIAGDVLTVFMSVLSASQTLSMIATPLNLLFSAKASAYKIFTTIDRIPDIDCQSIGGECPNECNGNIRFEDVQFVYPTRPSHHILKGLDIEIKKGETIALVGASGCGKSTTIQLIQRNYEPNGGRVTLDGKDIRELNIKWLRNQIGIVGQEPVLFAGTIRENIMLGAKEGATPSEEEMIECAKMANAHDFISKLAEGYDTIIGEKGALLSGGQKQRIAIARALIRKPSILLLDEATSALDTQSEKIVQDALEKASKGRTTIIVAHRLTTVRNADKICVFHQGEIIEQGTHQELMDLKGTYYGLVKRQSMEEEVDQETVENDIKKFRKQEDKEVENIIVEESHDEEEDIVSKIKEEYEKEKKITKKRNRISIIRIMIEQLRMNFVLFILATIGGIVGGAVFPVFTIKFIDLIVMMMELQDGVELTDEQQHTLVNTIIWVMGIAFAGLLSTYFYIGIFASSAEYLIGSVRRRMFKSIVKQEIGWFDRKENRVGSLVTRLSSDPTKLNGITGVILGHIVYILSTICFAFGFALYYDWKLALCVIAVFPIQTLILFFDFKLNSMQSSPAEKAYEESGITLVEAVESMKTVQSLTREEYFLNQYSLKLKKPYKNIFKWGLILALVNAITNLSNFIVDAYGYYLGTYLLSKNLNYTQTNQGFYQEFMDRYMKIQKAVMSVVFAAQGVGSFGEIIPDIGKSMKAARHSYNLIDRISKIESSEINGNTIKDVKGEIEFKNIRFRYPTRADNEVLKGISFKAEQGKTIALVGASGCGKSTTIQLIERFYDPTNGEVLLDGYNIKELNVKFIRNQIGLVGQEPVLFAGSVIDNIKRGVPEGVEVSNEQIYAAAKMANAHDFISAMAEGYNTMVGDRGSQLSGGQKQRIAIARALIRNPKVLLLDEATSALDSESEKIVQDALDKASKGRTTIIIAHRLSTIQNADKICVIMRGKIVEQGTHQELIDLKGFYYTLAMQQFGTMN